MTAPGGERSFRRPRISTFWRAHRARWSLPLVIIVIIGAVALVDQIGAHRISQAVAPQPPALVTTHGGTTSVTLDEPWSGFNPGTPAGAASSTTTLLASVLPSAYVVGPKLVPEVNSDLLLSVEATSTSPLTIQYVINPHAVWSDGVPVTADDFVYAWQSQRGDGAGPDGQPDQVASTLGYRDIGSVVGSDNGRTATVVFTTPFTDWRILFNNLLPAHVAQRIGWNGFGRFDPSIDLSAGPMLLQSVTSDRAVLVRNPRWWGTPAVLDRVVVSVSTGSSGWIGTMARTGTTAAQVTSFDLGTLDAVTGLPDTQSTVKPALDFLSLEFDMRSPSTGRLAVRQALAHLVDRQTLLTGMFGALDANLVVSEDHLATPSLSDYNASSAAGDYATADPVTADQLLRSAGYHADSSGRYVDQSGKALTLRMAVATGDPWIGRVAGDLVAQLHAAGIEVEVDAVDGAAGMTAAAAAGSYDMALVTRVASPYETVTWPWYSDSGGPIGSAGTEDWSRLADPQVDRLFEQASRALNPVTGGAIYAQIDDQLWDQMVALPLFEEPVLEADGVRIANVQYDASAVGLLWNLSQWTLLEAGPPNPKS